MRCGLMVALGAAVMLCGIERASGEEPFDYFRNSWNVIGLKDYKDGTRVTPDNRLLLDKGNHAQIHFGRELKALSRKQTKLLMDGWLPVVLITALDGPVRYDFTLWATPLPTAKDWRKAFDWPTEGENYLNWVRVKVSNTGTERAPAKVRIAQKANAVSEMAWDLAAGGTAEGVVRIPFAPVADVAAIEKEPAQLWLDRTVEYWRNLVGGVARIEVPCRKSNEALLAAHVCQFIANDHGRVHGGEGFYDEFYIRDGAYQVMELEEAGLMDAARKAMEFYLKSQRPDGRFESQKNQYDANGQAIWTLWQFHKISGDRAWLEKVYPQMLRAAEWAMRARRQAPAGSPLAGLMPAGPADGEHLWDGKHHIVGYDFWNLRGILCAADAARILGREDEARKLEEEAKLYRADIDAAWKRVGLPYFPPTWEKAGTHWGNTETLWPTDIFPVDDPRVVASIDELRHRFGGGFLEGTLRWTARPDVIHPYLSAYTTMASLIRGEHQQVAEDYYWYLLHSTATHAFPEGIYYKRRFAWSDTIPHVTGACNFAILLRHMLVHEKGNELHLLAGAPDWWLADGQEIRVERAPTYFGVVSMTVRGTSRGVRVEWKGPDRQPPARVVLHLPASRPLEGTLAGVQVVTRADQTKRWDFPTVVKLYREQADVVARPVPELVSLPVEPGIAADRCRMLDLSQVANTDPFTAPFGVKNPGKFLFTRLPVGRQVVGGVPFDILDAAKNGGRGLVVLHSPKSPNEREWPKRIELPVNATGKRLFFLGNVHGWAPDDNGAGEWGAVAQYVIHYADGQKQVVPLISGRTTDDWVSSPVADEAFAGLKGNVWHLNVLGVKLRPAVIEKIVFEDLGTMAAPLLVGVTIEQ